MCLVCAILACPVAVRAAEDADAEKTDARLEGYTTRDPQIPTKEMDLRVAMDKGGTGGTWIVFILVTVIATGVLFKNAKRSHLD